MSDPFFEYDGGENEAAPTIPTATTATTAAVTDGHTTTPAPAANHGPQTGPQPAQTLAQALTAATGWSGNADSPLLKSWAALVKLRQAHRVLAATPADAVELANRWKIITDAVNLMEHGPKLPTVVKGIDDITRTGTAITSRAGQIAALQGALIAGQIEGDKPLQLRSGIDPKIEAAFRADDDNGKSVRYQAAVLRLLVANYALDYHTAHGRLNPDDRIAEVRLELTRGNLTIEQVDQLSAELQKLEGSGARVIQENTNAEFVLRSQAIRQELAALASALVEGVKTQRVAAIAEEVKFFAGHDLPYQKTALSSQYDKVIADLKSYSEQMTKVEPHAHNFPMHPSNINLFGVQIPGLLT